MIYQILDLILWVVVLRLALLAGAVECTNCLTTECLGYDTKPFDGEVPVLELWEMWRTPSLPLLLGSPSMDQIQLFNRLLYLKPFNYVQAND